MAIHHDKLSINVKPFRRRERKPGVLENSRLLMCAWWTRLSFAVFVIGMKWLLVDVPQNTEESLFTGFLRKSLSPVLCPISKHFSTFISPLLSARSIRRKR